MRISSRISSTLFSAAALLTLACSGNAGDVGTAAGRAAAGGTQGPDIRYAIGKPASDSLIAAMNHDVGPDGAELPAGSGTFTEGAALYAAQCAQCHGVKGQGMAPAFPQLLGRDPKAENFTFANDPQLVRTIGNYWPYASTLFDYIKRAMPLMTPGSLTDSQVYSLVVFLLAKDQVIAATTVMDAAALRAVKMPYQDRFVPDDRKAGTVK